MVSQCANPDCSTPLLHLREGRLFQFEVKAISIPCVDSSDGQSEETLKRTVAHFWLCGPCSSAYSLELNPEDVQVVSRNVMEDGNIKTEIPESWLRSRGQQRYAELSESAEDLSQQA